MSIDAYSENESTILTESFNRAATLTAITAIQLTISCRLVQRVEINMLFLNMLCWWILLDKKAFLIKSIRLTG